MFKNTSPNHDLGKDVIHAAREHMFCASQFGGMVKRMHVINVKWNKPASGRMVQAQRKGLIAG